MGSGSGYIDYDDDYDYSTESETVEKTKKKGKNLYYDLFITFADVYKGKNKKVAVNRYRYNKSKKEYWRIE